MMMSQYASLLLVLLILCVASINSISSAKVVEVDVICENAPNPLYCSNLLNSNPGGAKGVDLDVLARYTLDVLDNNLIDTDRLIAELENAANDTVLQYYHRCSTDLVDNDSATIKISDAKIDLELKHYSKMVKDTDGIMLYILDCIDSVHENKTSPLLGKYMDVLRQDAEVAQVIAKYLNV